MNTPIEESRIQNPGARSRPDARPIRSDFRRCDTAHHYLLEAGNWQRAWRLAVSYRCPLKYRAMLRRRMRSAATFAVRLARAEAAHRLNSAA